MVTDLKNKQLDSREETARNTSEVNKLAVTRQVTVVSSVNFSNAYSLKNRSALRHCLGAYY